MKDKKWCVDTLSRISNKEALGYPAMLDFCWGMIRGWYAAKLISRKLYNELLKQFAEEENDE